MVQQTGFLAGPPSSACWLLREIPARRWGICAWDEAGPGWGMAEAAHPAVVLHVDKRWVAVAVGVLHSFREVAVQGLFVTHGYQACAQSLFVNGDEMEMKQV